MDNPDKYQRTWERAVNLLSRREHSEHELKHKLLAKGADEDSVAEVLAALKRRDYVSDRRFTEAFIHSRKERGDGPLKIRQALRARGVAEDEIDHALDASDPAWETLLASVWSKKFGGSGPESYEQWAKQARFLQNRGFSPEQIRKVVTLKERL